VIKSLSVRLLNKKSIFFCKYAPNFKKRDHTFIQIEVDNQFVTEPKDALVNNFKSILTHLVRLPRLFNHPRQTT
jgi:DNA-directed RNA polymerase subunit L